MGRTLHYGDNLDVLRAMSPETVDLVYLDPPFNSNANYNILFREQSGNGQASRAQAQAFEDTWEWGSEAARILEELIHVDGELAKLLATMVTFLGHNSLSAYLVMMAPRLVELRKVLRPTGSLYLHCDPTASHYLKVILDAVFGAGNFVSEIIWQRHNARGTTGRWPRLHDVILHFRRTPDAVFNPVTVKAAGRVPHTLITGPDGSKYQTYELTAPGVTKDGESGKPWRGFDPSKMGRHWANNHAVMDAWDADGAIHWPKRGGFPRRRDLEPFDPATRTVTVGDVWTDIDRLNQTAKERLGYPTQKPLALLERIVAASSNPGDVVLDPFCGCGTAIDAAEKLGRSWIGIDITSLAIGVISDRLKNRHGLVEGQDYEVVGDPKDLQGAIDLFNKEPDGPYEFQYWVNGKLSAQSFGTGVSGRGKKGGDTGIDGRIYFSTPGGEAVETVIVSVKGGQSLGPAMVRELDSVVRREGAALGVFVSLRDPTPGMRQEAATLGFYEYGRERIPRVQLLTVQELLDGKRPQIPAGAVNVSYGSRPAKRLKPATRPGDQGRLYDAPAAHS